MAVGQKAIIADAMKPIGERVHQEAANELARGKAHNLELAAAVVAVILPAEADMIGAELDEAAVADGDAVRVASEVGEDLAQDR